MLDTFTVTPSFDEHGVGEQPCFDATGFASVPFDDVPLVLPHAASTTAADVARTARSFFTVCLLLRHGCVFGSAAVPNDRALEGVHASSFPGPGADLTDGSPTVHGSPVPPPAGQSGPHNRDQPPPMKGRSVGRVLRTFSPRVP